MDTVAGFLKALAHPTRLAILNLLRQGERCVCDLWPPLGVEQPTLSKHLAVLRRHGLLTSRKDGVKVIYRLADERVADIIDASAAVASDLACHARVQSTSPGLRRREESDR